MAMPRWLKPGWAAEARLQREIGREVLALRDEPEPLEGTRMDLFNSIIPNFFAENGMATGQYYGTSDLPQRVWVANRCQQMNAQQIASMPIEWHGPPGVDEPLWVSSPDPNVFPNGVGDAIFSIVDQVYGWGFSCQYTTSEYANGYPRTFAILPSSALHIDWHEGSRRYKLGDTFLDPSKIVQIDRNPTTAAHGTSALRAYAQLSWGLLAAGNQSMTTSQGGVPQFYLQMLRKVTKDQAEGVSDQWAERTANRQGRPPVVPPEIEPKTLSINPSDLSLLETQEFNARAIATAYGVPSVLLNMALQGGLTYQNPGALGEMWWRFELRNTATRIANAFSEQMLPRGQFVTIDAADTFAELSEISEDNDPQRSDQPSVAAPEPVRLIGGGRP